MEGAPPVWRIACVQEERCAPAERVEAREERADVERLGDDVPDDEQRNAAR